MYFTRECKAHALRQQNPPFQIVQVMRTPIIRTSNLCIWIMRNYRSFPQVGCLEKVKRVPVIDSKMVVEKQEKSL